MNYTSYYLASGQHLDQLCVEVDKTMIANDNCK
jgi:hypothetical protein